MVAAEVPREKGERGLPEKGQFRLAKRKAWDGCGAGNPQGRYSGFGKEGGTRHTRSCARCSLLAAGEEEVGARQTPL